MYNIMKSLIYLTFVTIVFGQNNNYLPPNSANSAQISTSPTGTQRYANSKSSESGANILRYNNENNGDGSYKFEFETENKIQQIEEGKLKNPGTEQESIEVRGSYSYLSPDGQTITVNYIADENGFQPSGDHLPTPPPIPEAILRSLEINAAAEVNGNVYSTQDNSEGGYKY